MALASQKQTLKCLSTQSIPSACAFEYKKVKIPFEVISESIKVIVQWMKKKLLVAFDAIKKWGQPIADAIDDAKDVVKDGIDEVTGWFRSIGIGRRLLDSEDITSEKEADEEVAYHERIAKEMESRQLALAARYLGRLEAAYATYAPEMESHQYALRLSACEHCQVASNFSSRSSS